MKKIAVILSGCGVMDGSEIHEAVATLLAIDRVGAHYECLAPNIWQTRVTNHLTNETMEEKRNVLVEAARIARGAIKDIQSVNASEFNAAIYPGGYGAALNLCNFATAGAHHTLQKDVLHFAKAMTQAGKPQGFLCIAPALIAKIYGPGVKMTIGADPDTAKAMRDMGNAHETTRVTDLVIDQTHKVVTTPAYMLATHIREVFEGVDKLVQAVIALCR